MALDRAIIIDKAFEVLAKQGVEGLSTRRLAVALGVSGPSLYWHFKTKRELFDHMTEAMIFKAMVPFGNPPPDFDWLEWLGDGAREIRKEILSRPGAAQVFVGYRPTPERIAQGASPTMIVLSRIGLSLNEGRLILQTMARFVVGWTLDEELAAATVSLEDRDRAFEFSLGIFLRGVEVKAGELLAARADAKAG